MANSEKPSIAETFSEESGRKNQEKLSDVLNDHKISPRIQAKVLTVLLATRTAYTPLLLTDAIKPIIDNDPLLDDIFNAFNKEGNEERDEKKHRKGYDPSPDEEDLDRLHAEQDGDGVWDRK
jgi:hypothetical protein